MDKILSIIIPSYNMEAYLNQCLDSLIVPNLDAVEVLVINDGSKDRTSEIAHRYAEKYSGSVRVIDKANGHYGSCVNRGLAEASGKYVKVLDADDSFDNKNFQEYVDFLKRTDADMILSDVCTVYSDTGNETTESFAGVEPYAVLNLDDCFHKIRQVWMHSVAYRTSLLKENGYRQSEGIPYTDIDWSMEPLLWMKTCAYFPKTLYRYLIGREGQSMEDETFQKGMPIVFGQHLKVMDTLARNRRKADAACYSRAFEQTKDRIVEFYDRAILRNEARVDMDYLREYDNGIKSAYPELYEAMERALCRSRRPVKFIRHWRKQSVAGNAMLDFVRLQHWFRHTFLNH